MVSIEPSLLLFVGRECFELVTLIGLDEVISNFWQRCTDVWYNVWNKKVTAEQPKMIRNSQGTYFVSMTFIFPIFLALVASLVRLLLFVVVDMECMLLADTDGERERG